MKNSTKLALGVLGLAIASTTVTWLFHIPAGWGAILGLFVGLFGTLGLMRIWPTF